MKTEILTKDGLSIYDEEIKNYIDGKCVGSNNNTINSETEPTEQENNGYWIQEY